MSGMSISRNLQRIDLAVAVLDDRPHQPLRSLRPYVRDELESCPELVHATAVHCVLCDGTTTFAAVDGPTSG